MTSSPPRINFWEVYGPSMKRLNCQNIQDVLQYTEKDIEDAADIIISNDKEERLKFKTSLRRAIREANTQTADNSRRSQNSIDLRSEVKRAFDDWSKCNTTEHLIQAIDQYINQSAEKLDALVNRDALPVKPYRYQHQNFRETLYATEIDGASAPNLLIHELNRAEEEVMMNRQGKIAKLHESVINSHVSVMIGPSGSGKTRTIFEYLTANFGIFITASTALNGGSEDLQQLLVAVKTSPPLIRSIDLFYGFQSIVVIRLVFLQRLKLKYGERLSPYHWLMAQEIPKEIFDDDVFYTLSTIFKVNADCIDTDRDRIPVFLDESQAIMYSTDPDSMCCSGTYIDKLEQTLSPKQYSINVVNHQDSQHDRKQELSVTRIPIVRKLVSPILHSFTKLVYKKLTFVIAGTGLQFDEFIESLASQIGKRELREPSYIKLGSFIEFGSFKQYIHYYLPELSDKDLQKIHECVRGRYRFTARFIVFYLSNRDVETALELTSKNVVQSIINSLANKFPDEKEFFGKFKFLLEMMFNRFWSGKSIDIFNEFDSTGDAWLIENGLGLIRPQSSDLEIFDAYPHVLRCIQIVEPLAFEAIHRLMSPYNKPIKSEYIGYALHHFVKSPITDPSQLGFMIESPAALQFLKLFQDGKLKGKLGQILGDYELLEKRIGRPFSIRGDSKYTLLDFLRQDFWSEHGYTYVAITSELRKKVPDIVFVAKRKSSYTKTAGRAQTSNQGLIIVMLAFKYCINNLSSHCDSLAYDKVYTSKNKPITEENREFNSIVSKFSKCVRVLIQLGNEKEYSDLPNWAHHLRVDDLQFESRQNQQITTHRNRAPEIDTRRIEE